MEDTEEDEKANLLQTAFQQGELGPVLGVDLPASGDDVVDLLGAVCRLL